MNRMLLIQTESSIKDSNGAAFWREGERKAAYLGVSPMRCCLALRKPFEKGLIPDFFIAARGIFEKNAVFASRIHDEGFQRALSFGGESSGQCPSNDTIGLQFRQRGDGGYQLFGFAAVKRDGDGLPCAAAVNGRNLSRAELRMADAVADCEGLVAWRG